MIWRTERLAFLLPGCCVLRLLAAALLLLLELFRGGIGQMRSTRLVCLLALALALALPGLAVSTAAVEAEAAAVPATSKPLILELEHSVDGKTFAARSKFTVTLNAEGKYTVSEAEKNGIFSDSAEGFKRLLKDNAFYRIRTRALPGNSSSAYVSAALHACELQKSGFKEDLSVFLGPNRNVVGFSYSSPVIALSRSCDPDKLVVPTMLLTRLKVSEGEPSMVVPILAQGPKPQTLAMVDLGPFMDENLRMHGDKGQQAQGNQSFLRRYVSLARLCAIVCRHHPSTLSSLTNPHLTSPHLTRPPSPQHLQWYIVVALLIYFFMADGGGEPGPNQGQEGGGGGKKAE